MPVYTEAEQDFATRLELAEKPFTVRADHISEVESRLSAHGEPTGRLIALADVGPLAATQTGVETGVM
jgi:hypothetical protein